MQRHALPTIAVAALVFAGCSVQDEPTGVANPDSTTSSSTSTSVETTTTTTTTEAPQSTAVVLIGPARYELDVVCVAGGAGEVVVTGTGLDVNGLPVVGYIEASERAPYITLQVGDGDDAVVFEPHFDSDLTFEVFESGLTGKEIDFVSALNLETQAFVAAGLGSVQVDCVTYERELPQAAVE